MKIALPSDISGGDPKWLLDYLGLDIVRAPTPPDTTWVVSARDVDLISAQTLHGPALSRSRFDVSTTPTPQVAGGMAPQLAPRYRRHIEELQKSDTLPSLLEQITSTLIAVRDDQVPEAIRWASDTLAQIPLQHADGSTESLFAQHSVHDIRVEPLAYRWSKLPQMLIRLRHEGVNDVITSMQDNPNTLAFNSSGALLEGTIFGGLYFAPLLGNMSPLLWGFGAPRLGQVILYTFGRTIGGRGGGASRDQIDSLKVFDHHHPSEEFDTESFDQAALHKAAYSEAVDWWASRVSKLLSDLFSPATYIDTNGVYLPEAHQMWMLNVEQLLSRIGAILRNPTDQTTQLMLMFSALDILADSFAGGNGAGALMVPSRIRKRIAALEQRVPERIAPLILAPAYRALAAAEQTADGFFAPSPNPDATPDSRLLRLWNARRNTTHGFGGNAEILADHSGRLPADIILVPTVYLLDLLTDREGLLKRIANTNG
ncbi:hypothetical protein [Mycobacteroides salmoniphilum]|uniref:hypothetical protein n=1 Tax=Mycobacteroides salmoniphilum TaxID=404941 RepID=UPI00099431AC|nr:hypothetical protein [Mycobacteroides salmoniphilum]